MNSLRERGVVIVCVLLAVTVRPIWSMSANNSELVCEQRLPEAIIIGVKKSGTYALLKYLSINPLIKAAMRTSKWPSSGTKMNEIHYFDRDVNWARGADWYKAQMPHVCYEKEPPMVIEKTPGYFRSLSAPRRIAEFNSSTKLILIVREPVTRLRSELTHCDMRQKSTNKPRKCAHANEEFTRTLQQALNESAKNNSSLMNNKFVRNSVYYLDMLAWTRHFGLEQMLVVDGERFIREPWHELNRVERFLGLGSYIRPYHFYFDPRKRFYCVQHREYTNSFDNDDGRCLGKNKGRRRHIYLSEFVENGLKSFFAHWNRKFFDLIGHEFNWT